LRIAYIIEWGPYVESGVIRKIISQVQEIRNSGSEAMIYALVPIKNEGTVDGFDKLGEVIGVIHQDWLDKVPYARFGFWNKILAMFKLKRSLKEYKPDFVYYRQQGPWFPGLCSLLKRYPSAMELNTRDRLEIKMRGRLLSFLYLLTHKMIVDSVKGLVSVSHEIADDYREHNKPIAVIGNGFFGQYKPLTATANTKPQLVFIGMPNSTSACWHGTDKILRLAKKLPDFTFHIIGPGRDEFDVVSPNVIIHGHLELTDILKVYQECDLGLGTLALHRKAMQEASPLKTREYLSFGLPFIKGHTDTDIELNGNVPFVLDIGNYEENVEDHIEEIKQFANFWLGRRICDDLSFLSGDKKELMRLAFFQGLMSK
jgi:glycosyltransferase involved in cell wall biosynthesis